MKTEIVIKEKSALAKIAAFVLKGKSAAIVFGSTIHLHGISKTDFLADKKFLHHELKHVEQYRRYGFTCFIVLYLWQCIRHGYYNNRFEREAREAESKEVK